MCGIAGLAGPWDKDELEVRLRRMLDVIEHRGPDDEGLHVGEGFAFGMRRLSIIDLNTGQQPMWTPDGLGVVFNGEIYNYRDLRKTLVKRGRTLLTQSDTEVIPHLIEEGGLPALQALNGMFAFALHHPGEQSLLLVRDRLGVKPLYYCQEGRRFYFASEIKAILAALDTTPPLNRQALHHTLTLRYSPGPETMFQGIFKLPPGHRLSLHLKSSQFDVTPWWRLAFHAQPARPDRDYLAEFSDLFLDAVDLRLLASDVPVGVLLSGGLDSSAVAAAAVERGHKNFHTFSVAFEEGGAYSEFNFAREVAAHLGSRHREVVIGQKEFLDFLPQMARLNDEPLADLACVPLYYVSQLARRDVKVVLTGEGGDEVLAGYDLEQIAARLHTLQGLGSKVPAPLLALGAAAVPGPRGQTLKNLAQFGFSGYLKGLAAHITRVFEEEEKAHLWRQPPGLADTPSLIRGWYDACPSPHPLDQLQQVYCTSWLVEDLLMKADRMSMGVSLEARVPFLDYRLVEWAFSLPHHWKVGGPGVGGWRSKRVLRAFAEKRLPAAILTRPKQGFPVPAYDWLKGPVGDWVSQRLTTPGGLVEEMFDPQAVRRVLLAARGGQQRAAHQAWLLVMVQLWAEAFGVKG